MFIQTQSTPNPSTLKFLPDCPVTGSQAVAEFAKASEAKGYSDLAVELFDINGVDGVFLGHDFVSVTKGTHFSWETLKPEILSVLQHYLQSGKPVLINAEEEAPTTENPQDAKTITEIKEVLNNYIRPAVAGDGGDIAFHEYKDGTVYLSLRGACSGCPSSQITLKHGVESLLKHYVPQIQSVQEVDAT